MSPLCQVPSWLCVACPPPMSFQMFDQQGSLGSFSHPTTSSQWLTSMNGYSRDALRHFLSHALISLTQDSILKIKPGTRLQRGYDGAIRWEHWDLTLDTRNIITVRKGKKHVCNIWKLHGPWYMYICICAWTVFSVHLSAKTEPQLSSSANKQMSSTVLVYVYGWVFFPVNLLCFVLQRWKLFASEVRSS